MVKNNHVVNEKEIHMFHSKERKLVRSYLDSYNRQLKFFKEDWRGKSPKMIELESKRELCETLLG